MELPDCRARKEPLRIDVAYFRDLFNRELNRTLHDYRPHELGAIFSAWLELRMNQLLLNLEFSGELKSRWHIEAVQSILEECEHRVLRVHGEFLLMTFQKN